MLQRINIRRLLHRIQLREAKFFHWPSCKVRKTFLDFFKDRDHHFIRSSPVIPWNDASLAFINAGMNQFKPVFLGQRPRPWPRVTNSQKCIRVGGKHNDLEDVGRDTYHHTFFEMLGSWSFGDYFKRDACEMAWTLLTEVYKLPPERLYVTYFGGDTSLGLEADLEVRDIWESIGVPVHRILPFGLKDNFWEMGTYGPCGPCTEIHYDHFWRTIASDRVNLGVEDMIELWNLVFMQYERLKDGSLLPLNTYHVDTGMGLERITAVLNNKISNYETDLFQPIFNEIQKLSGKKPYGGKFSEDGYCIDTAYRILADHIRMITITLADGLFPEDSHKLRRVMRRAIVIGRDYFGFTPEQKKLVSLANIVAESLGEGYPELWSQLDRVKIILQQEEEYTDETRSKIAGEWELMLRQCPQLKILSDVVSVGLISALKDFSPLIKEWKSKDSKLPNQAALKLVDSYGLNTDIINDICFVFNLQMNAEGIQNDLQKMREMKKSVNQQNFESTKIFANDTLFSNPSFLSVPPTDDTAKYYYENVSGDYLFMPVEAKVLSIICNGQQCEVVAGDSSVGIILNSTNFYHEAGGQEGDVGELCGKNTKIKITRVEKIASIIVHWGEMRDGEVTVGETLIASVDPEYRLGCMQHHTATHLLNSAIRAVTGVSCQRSSHVTSDHLSLGVRMYQAMDQDNLESAERIVKSWVDGKCPVHRETLHIMELLQKSDVALLPGEVYPDNVHVISTKLRLNENCKIHGISHISSTEPCCGTHLLNTGDIGSFCITNVKSSGVGLRNIQAVCGKRAAVIEADAERALGELEKWEEHVGRQLASTDTDKINLTAKDLHSWRSSIESKLMPYVARTKIMNTVDNLLRLLRNALRGDANKQMILEMEDVVNKQPQGPVVHFLQTDFGTSKAVLNKASKIAKERPALVIARAEGTVVCRATLTKVLVAKGASATDWVSCVEEVFGGTVKAPRGQDPNLVCNFRGHTMHTVNEEKLEAALKKSKKYIKQYV
ncbi:hypothetical protein SK128_015943 [Halocaridina rubra]|uniref:Alanine--tRNA ligase n=1 Tax=Halocaridina rubra TaxID=373956 RepID=A0AAN8XQ62_HALRR